MEKWTGLSRAEAEAEAYYVLGTLEQFPEYEGTFEMHFCHPSDGAGFVE